MLAQCVLVDLRPLLRTSQRTAADRGQAGFLQGRSAGERMVPSGPIYGATNPALLGRVPLGVTTWTLPVVAPAGTLVMISESPAAMNAADSKRWGRR